jgi:hypothetical protein
MMTGAINNAQMVEVRIVQGKFIGKTVEKKSQIRPFETEEYCYTLYEYSET